MQTTRSRIIEYLNTNKKATSLELSKSLNLTVANIRHHINILTANDKVKEIGFLPTFGRGRPTKVFSLTRGAQDDNLGKLAAALIAVIFSDGQQENKTDRLLKIAEKLIGPTETAPSISIIQKINLAITRLNSMNYHARWEAHEEGPRIAFGNCPYSQIINGHPELCTMDTIMLENMLEMRFTQVSKLVDDLKGHKNCLFVVKQ